MNTTLLFIVPPVAGAIIGYVTNVIAIRMLFRPLNEIRVFGIRLPFTPGILPRQRKKLAVSIGSMVERELLTPEILRDRLERDDVREKIRQAISLFTESILEKTPKELTSGNFAGSANGGGKLLTEKTLSALEKIYPFFSSAVMEFLNRGDIRRELESKGRIIISNLMMQLNSLQRFFLSAGQYDQTLQEKMPNIIDELVEGVNRLFKEDRIKNAIIGGAASSLNRMIGSDYKTLKALLEITPEEKIKLDSYLAEKLTAAVDSRIEYILSSIDIKTLVSDRIDSLDMLRVERIILDVMSNQLKYVELFGGVLGFMLGLFQATFTYLIR